MARSERRDGLVVWGAMGLGLGLLTGFVLAEVVGKVDKKRLGRVMARLGVGPAPAPLSPGKAARAAALALAKTPELADLELETRALGPGRVELLGWVPNRQRRALAQRTVSALDGITGVVNRILVEAEDRDSPVAELALADQSA